jgi:hypothetical protein
LMRLFHAKFLTLVGLALARLPAIACDTNPTQMRGELSESSPAALVKHWWDGGKCEPCRLTGSRLAGVIGSDSRSRRHLTPTRGVPSR